MLRNKLIRFIIFLLALGTFNSIVFSEKIPSCILNYKFGLEKHIIIVEKSTQKLYIYSNYNNKPVKTFGITTGKKDGQKYFEGDLKTPEGIYYFRRTLSGNELPKTDDYGEKAFTMNFPNPIDKLERRKGSGIWLHGAFDSNKVETANSSRGCVVMKNNDLNTVSKYVFLNDTPIFIYKKIKYSTVDEIKAKRDKFLSYFKKWKNSWEKKDLENYIDSYSSLFRYNKMNIDAFKQHKKRLNKIYKFIKVKLSDITLYSYNNYYYASFNQLYISDKNHFYSKKIQYWKTSEKRPKIAFETTLSKPQTNKIEISKGNYITINQYRRNILDEQKEKSFSIYPSNISINKIDKNSESIVLLLNNQTTKQRLKVIPVLLLKNSDTSIYKSINNVSLKNGVPQERENAIRLNNSKTKITIQTEEDYFINSVSLFVFDNNNNFKQILTYFIKK